MTPNHSGQEMSVGDTSPIGSQAAGQGAGKHPFIQQFTVFIYSRSEHSSEVA